MLPPCLRTQTRVTFCVRLCCSLCTVKWDTRIGLACWPWRWALRARRARHVAFTPSFFNATDGRLRAFVDDVSRMSWQPVSAQQHSVMRSSGLHRSEPPFFHFDSSQVLAFLRLQTCFLQGVQGGVLKTSGARQRRTSWTSWPRSSTIHGSCRSPRQGTLMVQARVLESYCAKRQLLQAGCDMTTAG